MNENLLTKLLRKYENQGPRYTSYPIYPAWKGINENAWPLSFKNSLEENSTLSLYIHIPFCRTLCAFCGCTKMITKNYSLANEYIKTLHDEFQFYENLIPSKTKLLEIHLGGGSPSWLKANELKLLLSPILNSKKLIIDFDSLDLSVELDPRTTSDEHCENLRKIGFNRVSLGIQDTNEKVLKSIKREQSLELVTKVTQSLKKNGMNQLNMDLIYGFPFQTKDSIKQTIQDVVKLLPTRIALYSYAHVPNMKPAQKILENSGLPNLEEKMEIAKTARKLLVENGYKEIGMDHFALESDSLYIAYKNNELHRNFMGYTVQKSKVLLGLGPSSLSDTWQSFSQNEKDYKKWQNLINEKGHAVVHGHTLTEKEILRRKKILNLMCGFKTDMDFKDLSTNQLEKLAEQEKEKLLNLYPDKIVVSEIGKNFIRNICMSIDDSMDISI